jgi:hypothetical protein
MIPRPLMKIFSAVVKCRWKSGIHHRGLEFRHSRMLLAGPPQDFGRIRPLAEIQARQELDPRLRHSGVTPLGLAASCF